MQPVGSFYADGQSNPLCGSFVLSCELETAATTEPEGRRAQIPSEAADYRPCKIEVRTVTSTSLVAARGRRSRGCCALKQTASGGRRSDRIERGGLCFCLRSNANRGEAGRSSGERAGHCCCGSDWMLYRCDNMQAHPGSVNTDNGYASLDLSQVCQLRCAGKASDENTEWPDHAAAGREDGTKAPPVPPDTARARHLNKPRQIPKEAKIFSHKAEPRHRAKVISDCQWHQGDRMRSGRPTLVSGCLCVAKYRESSPAATRRDPASR